MKGKRGIKTVRLAIEHNKRHERKEAPLSDEQIYDMLMEIFQRISERFFEGYVLKLPLELGEICLGESENYFFTKNSIKGIDWEKTNKDPKHRTFRRGMSKRMYYLFWTPGEDKKLIFFHFRGGDEFNKELHRRIMEKEEFFTYKKDYFGKLPY